jgi:hypothetical protein
MTDRRPANDHNDVILLDGGPAVRRMRAKDEIMEFLVEFDVHVPEGTVGVRRRAALKADGPGGGRVDDVASSVGGQFAVPHRYWWWKPALPLLRGLRLPANVPTGPGLGVP